MSRRKSYRAGIVNIWVALLLTIFAGFLGIAIDTWHTVLAADQLQAGADAAALAAVARVRHNLDETRTLARDIAGDNFAAATSIAIGLNAANDPAGDIVIGRFRQEISEFEAGGAPVNAVRVRAPRTSGSLGGSLPLFFGPMFGTASVEVERFATAMVGGDIPLGIIVLDPTARCALDIRGSASRLVVVDAGIMVNSANADAICAGGRPLIEAVDILVHGGFDDSFDRARTDAELFDGVDPVVDPLASLPEPNFVRPIIPPPPIHVTGGGPPVALPPGYYSGITVNSGTANFAPGLFIIDGPFEITGGTINADGVMFYLTDRGSVNIHGNGDITISPMQPIAYPLGPAVPLSMINSRVSFFQARGNTNVARIFGSNNMDLDGRLYFPSALLGVGGGSNRFSSGIIVDRLETHGFGNMIINTDPVIQPIDRFVFLVE